MKTYNVQIPDYDYWRTQIKCQTGCPVDTDSRGYVRAIAAGDYEKAYRIARGPNPLASICGRVCAAPCEANCRRETIDSAVSIRALKRFVTEKYGTESNAPLRGLDKVRSLVTEDECRSNTDYLATTQFKAGSDTQSTQPVGIIGAGPAGLSAAHDLVLLGHEVVIYEAAPVGGGMLTLGVPAYRLPRDLIRAEVEAIEQMGVTIRYGIEIGKQIAFAQLREQHSAVLIAIGMHRSRHLPIPGGDSSGVLGGVDFLREVSLNGSVALKPRVAVVGGGNVAYDVARSAIRQAGVQEVHLFCLESLSEMPADAVEIREGDEEGIRRYNRWGPETIHCDLDGACVAFEAKRCVSVFDQEGRFSPTFDEFERMRVEVDNVILAVGQSSDVQFVEGQLETDHGRIINDPTSLVTSENDVFIAGDIAYGPRIAIDAVASGKKAARSIHKYRTGESIESKKKWGFFQFKRYRREAGFEKLTRAQTPATDVAVRKTSMVAPVEERFAEPVAQEQGDRCLVCNVQTVFNGEKCILCGGCADVCPQRCLKLVSLSRIWKNAQFKQLADKRYGDSDWAEQQSAIIKDEEVCIRCALCADRCPTGAITMEKFVFHETLVKEESGDGNIQ